MDAAPAPAPLPASPAPLTPEAAQEQLSALKADRGFVAKFVAGDAEARATMDELHAQAYPPEQTEAGGEQTGAGEPIRDLPLSFTDEIAPKARQEQIAVATEAISALGLEPELARGGIAMIERGIAARGGREMDAGDFAKFEAALRARWGSDYDARVDTVSAALKRAGRGGDWLRRAALAAGPDAASWIFMSLADRPAATAG